MTGSLSSKVHIYRNVGRCYCTSGLSSEVSVSLQVSLYKETWKEDKGKDPCITGHNKTTWGTLHEEIADLNYTITLSKWLFSYNVPIIVPLNVSMPYCFLHHHCETNRCVMWECRDFLPGHVRMERFCVRLSIVIGP